MKRVTYYVAEGFALEGDLLTFTSPGCKLGAQAVRLMDSDRIVLVEGLQSSPRVSLKDETVYVSWEVRPGRMYWRLLGDRIDGGGAYETNVYVPEPLSTALFNELSR